METREIQIGDVITDTHEMTRGLVIGESFHPLKTRPPMPCWVIRNRLGLEQLIFKHNAKPVTVSSNEPRLRQSM